MQPQHRLAPRTQASNRAGQSAGITLTIRGLLIACAIAAPALAAPLATYEFNGTLAASQPGVPALQLVDPSGAASYVTETVFGQPHAALAISGSNYPTDAQGGFVIPASLLLTPDSYSVEIVARTDSDQTGWRRILGNSARQSDNGFYVDPSNSIGVYPIAYGDANIVASNTYYRIVLTVGATGATGYLDGLFAFFAAGDTMQLQSGVPLDLFLDNLDGGGQGEWIPWHIATLRLYNRELTAAEVYALQVPGGCPPCSIADLSIAGACPDGVVDGNDFVAFINSFALLSTTIDPVADVNTDGVIDGADFVDFINAFALGC